MKRFSWLVLPLTLAACATSAPEKPTVPEKTAVTAPAAQSVKKTPAAYMSEQESELKALLSGTPFSLTRYNNNLILTFAGETIFAQNSYHPTPDATAVLQKIAPVLAKYNKTRISVIGYTDGMGKPSTNRLMSEKRADAVAGVLKKSATIKAVRFWTEGRGAGDNPAAGKNKVTLILTPTFLK